MTAGVGSTIGNGKTTKILDSVWAGDGKISCQAHNQNSLISKPLWVSDLLNDNRSWNDEVLNLWFDHHTTNSSKQCISLPLIKTMSLCG